jgi:hypothetical protein
MTLLWVWGSVLFLLVGRLQSDTQADEVRIQHRGVVSA